MSYLEEELYSRLGQLLREARENAGLSLPVVADKLGVTPMTIQRYEKGNRKVSIETIQSLCQIYNVDSTALMEKAKGNSNNSYYLDPDAAQIAQEVFERPQMKVLFDASRKVSSEDLDLVINMLDRMKKAETHEDEE